MIIYESFLEKTPLVRKLLVGAKPPPPEPPHSLRHCDLCLEVMIRLARSSSLVRREICVLLNREQTIPQ